MEIRSRTATRKIFHRERSLISAVVRVRCCLGAIPGQPTTEPIHEVSGERDHEGRVVQSTNDGFELREDDAPSEDCCVKVQRPSQEFIGWETNSKAACVQFPPQDDLKLR
jgi:hypothetical protein